MVKKHTIRAHEVKGPIQIPVPKLGGQLVWVGQPQWPLSRALDVPMRFIGQFALFQDLFGPCEARLAYLFLTDTETFVDGAGRPDSGENAVILQPGSWDGPVAALTQGPTLYESVAEDNPLSGWREVPREYGLVLWPGEDPEVLDEMEFRALDRWDQYMDYVAESKLGGTPAFLQYPEYPSPGRWRLLVQLNAAVVPVGLPFGDGGYGYAFLSEDRRTAKFLWQS